MSNLTWKVRAQKAEGELTNIDAVLARRPALSACASRVEKVELAVSSAASLDSMLRQYGNHKDGCLSRPDCSCGWDQVLELLRRH